jgi:hypothetical protein
MSQKMPLVERVASVRWRSLGAERCVVNSVVKNRAADPDWRRRRVTTMLSHESRDGTKGYHAMRAFAFAVFLCLPSLAAAAEQPQYNPYTKRYEYAPKGATLQYNPYRKQRELVGPGETLQYNPYTRKREYAPEGAMPRYNPYTKQRELAGPN